jgi:hypothetical protein
VYDRRVKDTVLTFGHAGRLYEQSFVMYDRQTRSQWVQATGIAMTGVYRGTVLELIPATVTSWQKWREKYPHTDVLAGRRREGFMGTYYGFYDLASVGLLVARFNTAVLYPFRELDRQRVLNQRIRDEAIVIAYYAAQRTATAWRSMVVGQVLAFRELYDPTRGFLLQDEQTETVWDPITGEALQGPLQGNQLEPVPAYPIRVERFRAHFPEGEVFTVP